MQDAPDTDIVTEQWLAHHRIRIPRASGVFQSPTAWIKVNGSGVIIAAGEKDQTVLAWLVETEVLSSVDVDYSIDYVTCRSAERAYRKQRGFKSTLDFSLLSAAGGLSCEQAAKVFCLVRRSLGHKFSSIVEYACDTHRSADTPSNYNPPYRQAFSALGRSVESAINDVKEGRVSDDPQEGLKKFLARAFVP
jgi:hypothetical protein